MNNKAISGSHVVGQNYRVITADGRSVRYVNLDNAASTPVLKSVFDDVSAFMNQYSSVHRGTGLKSRVSTHRYESARQTVLDFVQANKNDFVTIFGLNTTYAINQVAQKLQLKKTDIVIISLLEHHSNDLPWRRQCRVVRLPNDSHDRVEVDRLSDYFKKYDNKIKLVAITGASNVTGHITDISKVARIAHQRGALLLVDAAQLAPHRSINMKSIDDSEHIDFLAFSAHKMYAPFGTGVLVARRDIFGEYPPAMPGGGTIDFVSQNKVIWTDTPERDEPGSPNVVGAIALDSSIKFLQSVGMDIIAKHELVLTTETVRRLKELRGIKVFGDTRPSELINRTGVVSFTVNGYDHDLVAAILSAEWGIGVRSGCFCANPYVIDLLKLTDKDLESITKKRLKKRKQHVPGLVRVSFGMYNTLSDVDRLARGITAIVKGEHRKYNFSQSTQSYETNGWPR